MLSQSDKEILLHPEFHRLVRSRRWLSWTLLLVLLGGYFAYGALSIYAPQWLAMPAFEGGIVPNGVVMGYAILALTIVFTVVYVRVANHRFETLSARVRADVGR
jgi:uncharacterized membrane protein (DUF485 family)